VPGEFLRTSALREIEGGSNGKMPKPVRTDGEPGLRPEPADDEMDGGDGEASAFAGAVEVDEERAVFRASGLKPGLKRGLRRGRQRHRLLLRARLAEDHEAVARKVEVRNVQPDRFAAAEPKVMEKAEEGNVPETLRSRLRSRDGEERLVGVEAGSARVAVGLRLHVPSPSVLASFTRLRRAGGG